MARTLAEKEAQARYRNKLHRTRQERRFTIICNSNKDNDIINKLDSTENKNSYIKELIKQDISETT